MQSANVHGLIVNRLTIDWNVARKIKVESNNLWKLNNLEANNDTFLVKLNSQKVSVN